MPNTALSTHHFHLIFAAAATIMVAFFDYALLFYLKEIIITNFFDGCNAGWLYGVQVIGLFLGAYASHPVGGFLLGQYGDVNGRRAALFLSLLGLTVFTIVIAFLPTYAQIGVFAPILFVLARFGQGLAFGGQIPAALVLIAEQLPARHVGFGSGIVMAGAVAGVLSLMFVTTFFANHLNYVDLLNYGWRMLFLIGGMLSIGLLFALKPLHEMSIIAQIKERHAKEEHTLSAMNFDGLTDMQVQSLAQRNIFQDNENHHRPSLVQIITKSHLRNMFLAIIVSWVMLSVFIIITITLPSLLNTSFVISESVLIFGVGISAFFMMIGCMFYGYLIDRFNVGKVMVVGGVLFILQATWFFAKLKFGSELMLVWFALLGFSGGFIAALPVILTRLFPSKIRLTTIALTYNITYVLVAGGMPKFLGVATFHLPLAPALYLLLVGVVTIFLSFYMYYTPRSERDIAR